MRIAFSVFGGGCRGFRYPRLVETMSQRRLNRALLARQMLLGREKLDPVDAVERLGGLQAQEPASPFLALQARLDALEPGHLASAIHARTLVKATLMRATLHLVSAHDYAHFMPAIMPMLRALRPGPARAMHDESALEKMAESVIAHAAVPRSNQELRDHLASLGAADGATQDDGADPALWRVRRHVPFINAPQETAWGYGRRPSYVSAAAWLPEHAVADEEAALDHLVRRYLAAFGPASMADIAGWSGLTVSRFRDAVLRIPRVRQFHTEEGRLLYDVPDGPLPEEGVPAPVRLLPMWDSTLLAHRDRTRILPEPYRKLVIAKNGDVAPTYLVDGLVAGLWWTERDTKAAAPRIVFEPFEELTGRNRAALESEAERLLDFVRPHEPGVFGRFRGTPARRRLGA
jgi:hypothetical protein